eukprot:scaffold5662_cov149-Isochrysis_galbana.AAC.2
MAACSRRRALPVAIPGPVVAAVLRIAKKHCVVVWGRCASRTPGFLSGGSGCLKLFEFDRAISVYRPCTGPVRSAGSSGPCGPCTLRNNLARNYYLRSHPPGCSVGTDI